MMKMNDQQQLKQMGTNDIRDRDMDMSPKSTKNEINFFN